MGRGKAWTPEEDDFLIRNREHGPSWDGYCRALPGRTKLAITNRRKALGIAFEQHARAYGPEVRVSSPKPAPKPVPKQKPPTRTDKPWTDSQRLELVRLATEMVESCDHGLPECLRELGRLVAALREETAA